jgi:16S rRNA (guanine966-N2)-methyltransferase
MIALSVGAQGYALPANTGKDRAAHSRRGVAPAAVQKKTSDGRNAVRVIGGTWRGRRIRFEAGAELRPTPDRVRETLFNWLQGVIAGARCLDLFAGSGALGLEALSRGADEVVFIESDTRVAAALKRSLAELAGPGGGGGRIVCGDAFAFLRAESRPFDVVFLDPPFAHGWLAELCKLLEMRGWLAPGASVYLESRARDGAPCMLPGWQVARQTRAGEVLGTLARCSGPAGGGDAAGGA